ncbi:RNA polymerase II transcriptional coactivator KIWI [Acorus gramineus]|uniref:RNA polymerase II transcriptional coactivator KIWI n=1 Tax=Acorus gramineus TaxID=55184 RepID=A0AAV9BJT8_ACOGR|nr:RNA polymerase II transcriptional coactivator KIWI [Acorus gramineus]
MWKKGKRKSEDCEGADATEGGAPSSKSYKRASDDESDEITVCQVSKNRKVSVKSWQGNIMVSIREYYFKEGKELPTRKGPLSLSIYLCIYWNFD